LPSSLSEKSFASKAERGKLHPQPLVRREQGWGESSEQLIMKKHWKWK